jgi:molybdenum cofactor synthesis domain-containing protein
MIPVPEAIRIVIRETARILLENGGNTTKIISSDAPWSDILNSVLEKDVMMAEPGYPPYNASIMDGYCIRSEEFDVSSVTGDDFTHQVIDKVYAGSNEPQKKDSVSESNLPITYYITTGAVIPESFDCVVPVEEVKVSSDKKYIQIQKTATIKKNKWIRPVGCDIAEGSVVLPKGHRIDPVGLGLLKQSGAESIHVKRPIVVGVLSTGNELILGSKENASQPGKIPDVNRPILLSLLSSFGLCETVDLGMDRDDDVNAMARTIDVALERCDVIITTGGISMGESDIVEKVLVDQCGGTLHFGRMHMKPGTQMVDFSSSVV